MIIGVSVDDTKTQRAFVKKTKFPFPMLSDQKKEVAKLYGALDEKGGLAKRAYFIIDKEGIIRFYKESLVPLKNKVLLGELKKLQKK